MANSRNPIIGRSEITIDASVEKVWKLFAEEFAEIDKWSSGVNRSEGSGESVDGSQVSERACEISAAGFSDTKERILQYDQNDTLKYRLYEGLPGFVTNAENTWTFREVSGGTHVVGQTEMHVKGVLGVLLRGMMKRNLSRVLSEMAEEAKYYIETGRPHPNKVKATAKYEKKRARLKKGRVNRAG